MLVLCLHELNCAVEGREDGFLLLRNALERLHVNLSSFQMDKKRERKVAKLP